MSSIVSILNLWGISSINAERRDVLPAPRDPATRMDAWPSTRKLSKPAASGEIISFLIKCARVHGFWRCFLKAKAMPFGVRGLLIAATRV